MRAWAAASVLAAGLHVLLAAQRPANAGAVPPITGGVGLHAIEGHTPWWTLLEVHPDVYRRAANPRVVARNLAADAGVSDRVDWTVAERVIRARHGSARLVGR